MRSKGVGVQGGEKRWGEGKNTRQYKVGLQNREPLDVARAGPECWAWSKLPRKVSES